MKLEILVIRVSMHKHKTDLSSEENKEFYFDSQLVHIELKNKSFEKKQ